MLDHGRKKKARQELSEIITSGQLSASQTRKLLRNYLSGKEGRLERAIEEEQLLREVRQKMGMPTTYGQTETISQKLEPIEVPPGPMQELVNRKVTMELTEAGVATIVERLSEIQGLNIIADQALIPSEGGKGEDAEKAGGFMGAKNGGSGKKLTLHVNDAPLKEVLSYIARNMGIAFHLGKNIIWVTKSEGKTSKGPELETRIYRLRTGAVPTGIKGNGGMEAPSGGEVGGEESGGFFGGGTTGGSSGGGGNNNKEEELYRALETFLSGGPDRSLFRLFRTRNLLLVRDTRDRLQLAERLIQAFDEVPMQVLIEARFLSIDHEDLSELGLEIKEGNLGGDPTLKLGGGALNLIPDLTEGGGTVNLELSGIIGENEYRLLLHALEEYGNARTLSAPRITLLNNHTATIHRGTRRYYYLVEDFEVESISTGEDEESQRVIPTGSMTKYNFGITLKVRANVGNRAQNILLALRPEIERFEGNKSVEIPVVQGQQTTDGNGNGGVEAQTVKVPMPNTSVNSLNSSVVVKSNETVVLGGMIKSVKERNLRKIPLLADIPLLGHLFRYKSTSTKPEHLIIFVTARLVGPSGKFINYNTQVQNGSS